MIRHVLGPVTQKQLWRLPTHFVRLGHICSGFVWEFICTLYTMVIHSYSTFQKQTDEEVLAGLAKWTEIMRVMSALVFNITN